MLFLFRTNTQLLSTIAISIISLKDRKLKPFEAIRTYFKPIQPSVSAEGGKVVYQELEPAAQLKSYIHCYWQLYTREPLDHPFNYRVVSDGCIDIFFNLNNTQESFVMGFCHKYTEFSIGRNFNYGGIRFYPSIFPLLFGISGKILSDKDQPLAPILPELAQFISSHIHVDFKSSILKMNNYFSSLIQEKTRVIDDRFFLAFLEILKKKGHLETENGLNTGISPRQLRRLFNYYIGTTPKSFSQVVRFQYILNAKPSRQSLQSDKIYYDVGFFDQAHFIKNFTKFYGVTPSKAFR